MLHGRKAYLGILIMASMLIAGCGGGGGSPAPSGGGGGGGGSGGSGVTDMEPDAFKLEPLVNAAPRLRYASNAVTISGLSAGVAVPVSAAGEKDCLAEINGGERSAAPGDAGNGDTVRVILRAPDNEQTGAACALQVGDKSATFSVTTGRNLFDASVQRNRLRLQWNEYAGVERYQIRGQLGGHEPTHGGVVLVDNIPADVTQHTFALNALAVDWGADHLAVWADNGLDAQQLSFHSFQLTQDLSREAIGYAKASNTAAEDRFGFAVALAGERMAVGAPLNGALTAGAPADCGAAEESNCLAESGSVYVFRRDADGNWQQEAFLKADNADAFDWFGSSVAFLGDELIVGAPGEDSNATGVNPDGDPAAGTGPDSNASTDSGAVYVFRRDGDGWRQHAYMKSTVTFAGAQLGHSLAADGERVAAGSPAEFSGFVDTFRRDADGVWSHEAWLQPNGSDSGDLFGYAVALRGDLLVVGAPGEDSAAAGINPDSSVGAGTGRFNDEAESAGAVYVYRHDGNGWVEQAYVKSPAPAPFDNFGLSVAADTTRLAVGAPYHDSGAGDAEADCGSATPVNCTIDSGTVFVLAADGAAWRYDALLKASHFGERDYFGTSLALDGDRLLAGAPGEDGANAGIDGDATNDDAPDSGAAYLFAFGTEGWTQRRYIKSSNPDGAAAPDTSGDEFGYSLALDDDLVVIGAPNEDSTATGLDGDRDNNGASNSGAVYLY